MITGAMVENELSFKQYKNDDEVYMIKIRKYYET